MIKIFCRSDEVEIDLISPRYDDIVYYFDPNKTYYISNTHFNSDESFVGFYDCNKKYIGERYITITMFNSCFIIASEYRNNQIDSIIDV